MTKCNGMLHFPDVQNIPGSFQSQSLVCRQSRSLPWLCHHVQAAGQALQRQAQHQTFSVFSYWPIYRRGNGVPSAQRQVTVHVLSQWLSVVYPCFRYSPGDFCVFFSSNIYHKVSLFTPLPQTPEQAAQNITPGQIGSVFFSSRNSLKILKGKPKRWGYRTAFGKNKNLYWHRKKGGF